MMDTAPISRDLQIQFMQDAARRREERIARWSRSEEIKNVLREEVKHADDDAYERCDTLALRYA